MTTLKLDLTKPTCRVCLKTSEGEEMSSIFDLDADFNDLHIYEKIEQCADIKVFRCEKMPTLICSDCYSLLKLSYKFRTMCRKSEEYLNQFVRMESESPKVEKSIDENPLSISKSTSKRKGTQNQSKKKVKDCKLSETIKKEEISASQSPKNSEHLINDFDCEEWFNIDYQDDEDDISCGGNIEFSIETVDLDMKKEIKEETQTSKNLTKRKKTSNAKEKTKEKKTSTEPTKSLGISSDGEAVIVEKTPRARRTKKDTQPHICEVCGNIYQRRYSLELHMRRHRDEKPFACEICAHAFHSNFQLIRHMRKHTGARPYKCSYCPRAFGDQSTLIKHERVHRNERPFKCEICGKSFSYTGVLNYHKLIHTGEKPYACEICGKCFPRAHNLRAHLETLQHQNDPRTKMLLQNIRKNNEDKTLKLETFPLNVQ